MQRVEEIVRGLDIPPCFGAPCLAAVPSLWTKYPLENPSAMVPALLSLFPPLVPSVSVMVMSCPVDRFRVAGLLHPMPLQIALSFNSVHMKHPSDVFILIRI